MHVIGYTVAIFNIVYLVIVLYRFLYRGFNYLFIIDRAKYGIGRLGTKLMFVFNAASIALGLFLALSSNKLVMVLSAAIINLTRLLMAIPFILMCVALYRLGNDFNSSHLTGGAVVFAVGLALLIIPIISAVGGFVAFIGLILVLIGL